MPARTGYVAGSPPWGFPYAGTSTSTSPYPYSSPTYTISSFSASPGPMSPPPLNHSRSPYACAPLPALSCDMHSALSALSRHRMTLDVSYDPAYTYLLHRCSHPACLQNRLLLHTSPTSQLSVTLCLGIFPSVHVLNGIYRDLRRPVRTEELEAMALPPHFISSVRQAFYTRCSRLAQVDPAAANSETRKGIRRIDFLLGNSLFAGLVPTKDSPDNWQLTFS
ncbi:hypothetical protein B0H13DRAFT_1945559 [Mycena leptocephala]|nr:hypothetical protein B0H13DRAFT_1945559 [Mycena leptocephala]